MSGRRWGARLFAIGLALACGRGEEDPIERPEAPEAAPHPEAPPPEGRLVELILDAPRSRLGEIRRLLPVGHARSTRPRAPFAL
ncbi:MAG TPA: hypothetical protein RMH99_23100 [Sandaracinaceae bacterium LLY-WYZ-13_1]|nr:hypothetical protein [Sandaracinaceae bacterium LLY-WYZ-13_1]